MYLQGGNVAKGTLEGVKLILGGWLETSAKLFVVMSSEAVELRGTFSVEELTKTGVILKSLEGDAQLRVMLDIEDSEFWYWQPREFTLDEDFASLLETLPEADKYRSALGLSFSGRATAPICADLLIPLGRVVLMSLWE
jgi:hypothetical protein